MSITQPSVLVDIAKFVFPAFSLLCSTALLSAADSLVPGQIDIDPPTLAGGGYQWWVEGDDNRNASLEVHYRENGSDAWQTAPEPLYHDEKTYGGYTQPYGGAYGIKSGFSDNYPIPSHFAGSLFPLSEGTSYEVRLRLRDPDGITGTEGVLEKIVTFKTRSVPQSAQNGRKVEVFADGSGASLEEAIADLQPGDSLLLHAGTYTPPAFDEPATKVSDAKPVDLPEPGRILHVYPPDYKGEKQEPHFRNLIEAYAGGNWDADFNYQAPIEYVVKNKDGQAFGAQPGDTILLHPGNYESAISDYHHIQGMWPTGAYYFSRRGTAENPIVIKAAEGGEVILDGDGAYRFFDLRAAKHHIIDGLTIRNAYIGLDVGDGRNDLAGENIIVQNCTFENVHRAVTGDDVEVIATNVSENAFPERFEGTWTIATDGTPEMPITIKPFGDGPVVFDGNGTYLMFDTMAADHLIFENLIFTNCFMTIEAGGRLGQIGSTGLTIKANRFEDVIIGLFALNGRNRDFTILDNFLISQNATRGRDVPIAGGYGVVLNGAGHAVAYNHVEAFWDSLNVLTSASPLPNQRAWSMDFYNNYCIGARDNIFEIDGGMWNIRIRNNLVGYSNSFAFSSQPLYAGPGYYYRNILYHGNMGKALRSGGIFYINNTVVGATGHMKNVYNSAFLSLGVEDGATDRRGRPVTVAEASGDFSNNAWRLGGDPAPGIFRGFGNNRYDTFEAFKAEAAQHDILVDFSDFVNVPKPADLASKADPTPPFPFDIKALNFHPAEGSPLIDAGMVIPGLTDDYVGEAPDIGALEKGRPAPHYGPRTEPPTAN